MDDNITRSRWKAGSTCQIFSGSLKKWCQGEITQVFIDEEGEWLEIRYNKSMSRQLPRYSSSIRPNNDEKDEEQKNQLNSINNGVNHNNDAIIFTMCELSLELSQMFKFGKIQDLTTKLQQQLHELDQKHSSLTIDTSPTCLNFDAWIKTQNQLQVRRHSTLPYIHPDYLEPYLALRKCVNCNIELCVSHKYTSSDKCLIATYIFNKLEYQCKQCLSLSQYKHLFSLSRLIYESIFRKNIYEINIINVITNYLYDNVVKCENNSFWNCSKTILIEKNIEKQITDFSEYFVDFRSCIIQNRPMIICNHCHHDKEDIDCSDCDDEDISDIE